MQEAWLRWARTDHSVVVSPPAFLALTTVRLALNASRSARRRRVIPAGSWLPETADDSDSPETAVERQEEVDTAIRLLLERLTLAERAVHLLRTAFDYPHRRISEVLHLREGYTRQLLHRARAHLTTARVRPVSAAEHRRLVRTFRVSADTLDLSVLEELLIADVAPGLRMAGDVQAFLGAPRGDPLCGRRTPARWRPGTWPPANGRTRRTPRRRKVGTH